MVKQARALNPDISFQQGDMLALTKVADNAYGGIAAFYSLIHIPRQDMVRALREIKRVLCPRGVLLVTFHIGHKVIHLDEWWNKKVSADFIFYETTEMKEYLKEAGFEQEEAIGRDAYPNIEYQSRWAYIFARKPE
jgi:ubiquinone/menaquinone biosynthesis C-methylase UbiE